MTLTGEGLYKRWLSFAINLHVHNQCFDSLIWDIDLYLSWFMLISHNKVDEIHGHVFMLVHGDSGDACCCKMLIFDV
jgi:hypothetical protein